MWEGWNDWRCKVPPTNIILCACEKSGSVYLKLRGRCSESVIDTYWTVQTNMGRYFLHGIETSVIEYDDDNNIWNLRSVRENFKNKNHHTMQNEVLYSVCHLIKYNLLCAVQAAWTETYIFLGGGLNRELHIQQHTFNGQHK